ncbi:unnamed protein product [Brachionus calyciflorus]|uniref:RING-type domain-containing protein n=1 Tax=Brachionus calyciflorus TaxID=104777 RepID=A0A813MRY1_9BILA|nr:unnamed protein product [Brachionus calyciflorus]
MNEIDLDKHFKFEDLQKASFILRKALKDIRSITNDSNSNSLDISSSSSSISENEQNTNESLAFDNFTYSSSIESLSQTNLNQEWKKTTLKSLKRKDKLKKDSINQTSRKNIVLYHAKSMPSLEAIVISNNEYEKQLRKVFRNQSLNRSIRRAKSVYYRNRRSKSLEDLTVEEKINFLMNSESSYLRINSTKFIKSRSIDSYSSATSNGLASDISSSYFHELSDWSPVFSSESDLSDDGLFNNVDWDKNLSNVAFSDFNSTDDSDSELDEDNQIFKKNLLNLRENKINCQCLKEILSQNLDKKAETIEYMLNKVMNRMLNIHPRLQKNTENKQDLKKEFLRYFEINHDFLNGENSKLNCLICLSNFNLKDEACILNECEHIFHKNCIQLWLKKSTDCPKCSSVSNSQLMVKRETLL